MYSDTLDIENSFHVLVSRLALLSRKTFDVPVRRLDAKGLSYTTKNMTKIRYIMDMK